MRQLRIIHALFVIVLLIFDAIVTLLFDRLGLNPFVFISSMHFIALILMAQNESFLETISKTALVALWLELNHVGSLPVFFVSYILTMTVIYFVQEKVGTETSYFLVLLMIALSLKEIIVYLLLIFSQNVIISPSSFITYRSFWLIFGNILLSPLIIALNKYVHRFILQRTQNNYMR